MTRRRLFRLLTLLLGGHFFWRISVLLFANPDLKLNPLFEGEQGRTRNKPCFGHAGSNSSGGVLTLEVFRRIADEGVRLLEDFPDDDVVLCPLPGLPKEVWSGVQEIVQRRARLLKTCRAGLPGLVLPHTQPSSVQFIEPLNVVFCVNPKTGTTTWKWHFFQWLDNNIPNTTRDAIHELSYKMFPCLLETYRGAEYLKERRPLTIFITRHPYERFLSAYREKILLKSDFYADFKKRMYWASHGKTLQQMLSDSADNSNDDGSRLSEGAEEDEITFPEFVRFFIKSFIECEGAIGCMSGYHDHWWPQHLTCPPCDLDYDIVAKTESHSSDYAVVEHILAASNLISAGSSPKDNKKAPTADAQTGDTGLGNIAGQETANKENSPTCKESNRLLRTLPGGDVNLISNETNPFIGSRTDLQLNASIDRSKMKANVLCYMNQLTSEEKEYLGEIYLYDFIFFGYNRTEYS